MTFLKKTLVFCLVLCVILEQVYVFHFYFFENKDLDCSGVHQTALEGKTIIESILRRFRLEQPTTSSTLTPLDPSQHPIPSYHVFFLIMSEPSKHATRVALRDTWIRDLAKYPDLGYKFVIGTGLLGAEILAALELEEKEDKDIVFFGDFEDNKLSITPKVLKAYVWAYENVKADYLVKLNDNSYVVPENLLNAMKELAIPSIQVIMGKFMWKLPVNKKENERWGEPDWFLCPETYLPFPRGEGYLVSWDIVEFIRTSADDFRIYRHDDITMGLWVCGLELKRIDSIGILLDHSDCKDDTFIFGNLKIFQVREKHLLWNNNLTLC